MFYIDSQRTVTRRDSSLILSRSYGRDEYDGLSTTRGHSTARLSDSGTIRPKGSVRKEIITVLFESMLDSIVESWTVIEQHKNEVLNVESSKTNSEIISVNKKKKPTQKPSKTKKSRSKIDVNGSNTQSDLMQICWWTAPDEKAVIHFRNGNTYEGCVSMKCMHGEGRYQWADGTTFLTADGAGGRRDADGTLTLRLWQLLESHQRRVAVAPRPMSVQTVTVCTLLGQMKNLCVNIHADFSRFNKGQFTENEMDGKGIIHWKDDTWYEGDFAGNLRHGKGLYVNSREQCSYAGHWHYGTKHGDGAMYFPGTIKNSYDGNWVYNVRHGFGSREYSEMSGYKGEWNEYLREGKGLMIWPNHDFYRGEWKNGVMSGYGCYIWDAYYNNSMSSPSLCSYRGFWEKGKRNGYGVLNLGLGLGSYYKGEYKNNKKHGVGKFVTNNGLILQHKHLFVDDNVGPMLRGDDDSELLVDKYNQSVEPFLFDICDSSVGLVYHIEQVIKNIDKQQEIRTDIVNEFLELNKIPKCIKYVSKDEIAGELDSINFDDLMEFEVSSLSKSLTCFETKLKNIYYQYATICNKEEIYFTPILIRLYLWQLYYDCNIHEKGLTLVEIDKAFHENPRWLSRAPHNPFEKIYFWQFQHSLITVASKLYAKRQLPGKKPDTMLASAFRIFMEKDILPGACRRRGKLAEGYGAFVPLKCLYGLYRSLGEPCTIRSFLRAVRHPPHDLQHPTHQLAEQECHYLGRNAYIFGDEMSFINEESTQDNKTEKNYLKLFNIGNLSSKSIIQIFQIIFPNIFKIGKIMDLTVEINFFEFFEAFITCIEESIRIDDEERDLREKYSASSNADVSALPKTK